MNSDEEAGSSCCGSAAACVFAKAVLARAVHCGLVQRRSIAERELIECTQAQARNDCQTLLRLTRERARFAMKLPSGTAPLLHAQALRLQCGGLLGLQRSLAAPAADVHDMVDLALERHGSLTALPWDAIVAALMQWQPRTARRPQRRPQGD